MTAPNRAQAIRSAIARLGAHAAPRQIVAHLAELNIEVSETHVRRIKLQLLRREAKATDRRRKPPIKDRRRKRPQHRKIPGGRG